MSRIPTRPSVLLVEDSEDDAFFFRRTLQKSGVACDLTYAADGAAAIHELQAARSSGTGRRPDLVFLDLKMPTCTGFEVLSWILAQRFNPPLDVAVLSGSEQVSDRDRSNALGASDYYVKPLSVEQLQARFVRWQERAGPEKPAPPDPTDSARA